MVVLGDCPADYEGEVRKRCTAIYQLLLAAARPVLQHGTEPEVTGTCWWAIARMIMESDWINL